MKEIKVLNIENYNIEDKEFVVGEGDNKHHVCVHTFTRYHTDEEGDEVEENQWHQVVMVYKGSYNVGMAHRTQGDEYASTFHDCFAPAYRSACAQIGVTPCIVE